MDKTKRPKRDTNTTAFSIVRQATGQEPKRQPPPEPEPKRETGKPREA